jgi:hypothetical protein
VDRCYKLSNIVDNISGIAELWKGIHVQVDAKPESSSKLWDVSLRHQVNILNCE